MNSSDPIADLLTRLRNAQAAGHDSITLPSSKMKVKLAQVLSAEGYVGDVTTKSDDKQGTLTVGLKYGAGKVPVISEVRRVSTPGRRVYVGVEEIPRVRAGLGIAVLSTPKGIVADREARKLRVGGELLCTVW